MHIRDPIHRTIEISEIAERLIDDRNMQRLRYLRQLGFAYLVYPGANHTRFEHSLGAMHMAGEIGEALGERHVEELQMVGLLHDIGHGPFSHQSEPTIRKYLHRDHEQVGEDIIRKSSIKDIISGSTLSFKRIMGHFRDQDGCAAVGGTLGADRIDYLVRDSYYTGVAYGVIDYERIIRKLAMHRGRPAIYEQGVTGAESMLIARYFMFANVYGHHTAVIADNMFRRALEAAIDGREIAPEELIAAGDDDIFHMLGRSRSGSGLIRRIKERRLFKRAYYADEGSASLREVEQALERAGLSKNEYIAETIEFPIPKDNLQVINRDGKSMGSLSENSEFVKTLVGLLKSGKKLIVATDGSNIERARAAVKKAIG